MDDKLRYANWLFINTFLAGCKVNLVKPLLYAHPTLFLTLANPDALQWLFLDVTIIFSFLDLNISIIRRFLDILLSLIVVDWTINFRSNLEGTLDREVTFHLLLFNTAVRYYWFLIVANFNYVLDLISAWLARVMTSSRLRQQNFDLMEIRFLLLRLVEVGMFIICKSAPADWKPSF
jgi:hypothetical protein